MSPEAPEVYCPREGKNVPFYWCFGSNVPKRKACSEQIGSLDRWTGCKARNFVGMEIYR